MRCALALALGLFSAAAPGEALVVGKPYAFGPDRSHETPGLVLRGALQVSGQTIDGFAVREISGLAWDSDERVLYGLSDDGYLVHLRPRWTGDRLTGLVFLAAFALHGPDGQRLAGDDSDTEGLAARRARNRHPGDTELLVAMDERPWVSRFSPTGRWLGRIPLAGVLADRGVFEKPDELIEAIAVAGDGSGVLLIPERPLRGGEGRVPIVVDGASRGRLRLADPEHATVVAADLTAGRDLLVLERVFESLWKPTHFFLKRIASPAGPGEPLEAEVVGALSSRGEHRIDNFEALARHEGDTFFMMSDDNKNAFQKALLIYFELQPHAR